MKGKKPVGQAALIAILVLGIGLRTIQYSARSSLPSDEAAVALNVTERGWGELLLQPLAHDQVAPLGFLSVEKLSVAVGENTEAAFRFFPYLFSLVALILFWRLSARYLEAPTALAALIVFALSPTLVLFAGIAKQYTGDMAVTMLLLLIALRFLERPVRMREAVAYGIAGGAGLLFSQPSVLVAAGLGAVLVVQGWKRRKPARQVAAVCVGWGIGAAVITVTSLATLSASTSDYMGRFWGDSFVPAPWLGLAELVWIPLQLAKCLIFFIANVNTPRSLPVITLLGIYGVLSVLGVLHLIRKNALTALVLAIPILVALGAATLRLLPLNGRIGLYIGPSLLIGCFAGFDRLRTWVPARIRHLVYLAAFGFAALPGLALLVDSPPPKILNATRPVMERVRAHWLPGDAMAFSGGQWAAVSVDYYGNRFGIDEWTPIDRIPGRHSADEILRGYLYEIDAFRGRSRAWLYLEGVVPCEEEAMVGYLSVIGRRLHSAAFQTTPGNRAVANLFDLSDPDRLSATDAARYPVPDCSAGSVP